MQSSIKSSKTHIFHLNFLFLIHSFVPDIRHRTMKYLNLWKFRRLKCNLNKLTFQAVCKFEMNEKYPRKKASSIVQQVMVGVEAYFSNGSCWAKIFPKFLIINCCCAGDTSRNTKVFISIVKNKQTAILVSQK